MGAEYGRLVGKEEPKEKQNNMCYVINSFGLFFCHEKFVPPPKTFVLGQNNSTIIFEFFGALL